MRRYRGRRNYSYRPYRRSYRRRGGYSARKANNKGFRNGVNYAYKGMLTAGFIGMYMFSNNFRSKINSLFDGGDEK